MGHPLTDGRQMWCAHAAPSLPLCTGQHAVGHALLTHLMRCVRCCRRRVWRVMHRWGGCACTHTTMLDSRQMCTHCAVPTSMGMHGDVPPSMSILAPVCMHMGVGGRAQVGKVCVHLYRLAGWKVDVLHCPHLDGHTVQV